jgi:putative glutamine amidotransferase
MRDSRWAIRDTRHAGDVEWGTGNEQRGSGDGSRGSGDGRRETGDGRRETGDGRRETVTSPSVPPVIGITAGHRNIHSSSGDVPGYAVLDTYVDMVTAAGGLPVLLTPVPGDSVAEVLHRLDAVVFSGGGDVDPARYGGNLLDSVYGIDAERDEFELALARAAAGSRVPALCICRGTQVMNVALGGSLLEDIRARIPGALDHWADGDRAFQPHHSVEITPGSSTAKVLGVSVLEVNSVHHQALDRIGTGLVAAARAPDGVVEAVEPTDGTWPMWAVQWHPEYLGPDDLPSRRLFVALVDAADE